MQIYKKETILQLVVNHQKLGNGQDISNALPNRGTSKHCLR